MESISTFFKKEEDIWYREGEATGEAKKSQTVVENLINKGFGDDAAAEIAGVEIEFVKNIRTTLASR